MELQYMFTGNLGALVQLVGAMVLLVVAWAYATVGAVKVCEVIENMYKGVHKARSRRKKRKQLKQRKKELFKNVA